MSTTVCAGSVGKPSGWVRRFLMALRDAVPRGDMEPFADHLGHNYNTVKSGLNPDNKAQAAHAAWVPEIIEYFDNDEPIHVLARMRGGMYLPPLEGVGEADGSERAQARAVRRVGEMMTCHADHLDLGSDGGDTVTREEWRERAEAAYSALVAVEAYRRHCEEQAA